MKYTQSIGDRKSQEDGFFCGKLNYFKILGIIDGHGGDVLMRILKENYINILKDYLLKNNIILKKDNFLETIKNFYLYLDDYFIRKKIKSGCCISVVFCNSKEKYINIVQLGDTKVIVLDDKLKFLYETKEHRLVESEINRILKLEGSKNLHTFHNIKRYKTLMISRVLGDYELKNPSVDRENDPLSSIPDIINISYFNKIHLIMITDGVYDLLNLDNIITLCIKHKFNNLHKVLMNSCLEKKKRKDNLTIIIEEFY